MFPRPSRLVRFCGLAGLAVCVVLFLYELPAGIVDTPLLPSDSPWHQSYRYSTRVAPREHSPPPVPVATGGSFAQKATSPTKQSSPPPPPPATPKSVNPHNFNYTHNPVGICGGRVEGTPQRASGSENIQFRPTKPVSLLIYIHSAPGHLKKRQAVRQTWAHPTLLKHLDAAAVFLLGRPASKHEQELIDFEFHEYGDLVQEDFLDTYRNLTYKGVAGLRWISQYCPSAVFLLKTDDDILVDIVSLVADLHKKYPTFPVPTSNTGANNMVTASTQTGGQPTPKPPTRVILCNLWTRMKVMRDPKSKWFIPPSEFAPDYFSPYCSGSAFLLSADLAPLLYRASLDAPFFWVDDFYVTGVLVKALSIQHARYNKMYLLNANLAESRLANDTKETLFFHVKKLDLFLRLWPLLLNRHSQNTELKHLIPVPKPTPQSIIGDVPNINGLWGKPPDKTRKPNNLQPPSNKNDTIRIQKSSDFWKDAVKENTGLEMMSKSWLHTDRIIIDTDVITAQDQIIDMGSNNKENSDQENIFNKAKNIDNIPEISKGVSINPQKSSTSAHIIKQNRTHEPRYSFLNASLAHKTTPYLGKSMAETHITSNHSNTIGSLTKNLHMGSNEQKPVLYLANRAELPAVKGDVEERHTEKKLHTLINDGAKSFSETKSGYLIQNKSKEKKDIVETPYLHSNRQDDKQEKKNILLR